MSSVEHFFYDGVFIKDAPFVVHMKLNQDPIGRFGFFVMPKERLCESALFRVMSHSGKLFSYPEVLSSYTFEVEDLNSKKKWSGSYDPKNYQYQFKRKNKK